MRAYPALVAAAGASSRCPEGKLLKAWRGRPLLAWLLETLVEHPRVGRLLVLTGHRADEVQKIVNNFHGAETLFNPEWSEGISSSLRLGESQIDIGEGFLVALGDVPFFSAETLESVLPTLKSNTVNVPTYQGRPGHPVYIPEWARRDWVNLQGDQGAKQLFYRWGDRVRYLPTDDPAVVRDFDRASDFEDVLEKAAG